MTMAALVTGITVPDARQADIPAPSLRHFLGGIRGTFVNRHFNIVFATFCLMTVAAAVGQSIQLIVIKYRLEMYDFFPAIALVFALSFAGSFPLWLRLSRRVGKHRALMIGLALGCVVPFGWLLVQPGQRLAMLLFMFAGGMSTGSVTLALSQAIDVIDFDELATGEKRAGAYFGVWTLGLKSMSAIGTLLGGLLLSLVNYVPQQTQNPATLWWLVVLVGPVQAGVHLIGLLVFRRLQFTADDIARVQAALDARRAAVSE
jgi:Na+/melibiose symporter-like transporter